MVCSGFEASLGWCVVVKMDFHRNISSNGHLGPDFCRAAQPCWSLMSSNSSCKLVTGVSPINKFDEVMMVFSMP